MPESLSWLIRLLPYGGNLYVRFRYPWVVVVGLDLDQWPKLSLHRTSPCDR